jgi:hypothetical protein
VLITEQIIKFVNQTSKPAYMPKADEIISGLQSVVDANSPLAIIWHVVFYILITALMLHWKPSDRLFGLLLTIPLLSVAVLAWSSGNPFNGTFFSAITLMIFIFALKTDIHPVSFSPPPFMVIGLIMICFGLVYPHFIKPDSFLGYLYTSPLGLIPCPTLSILIGFVLLFNGFGSQAITLTFVIFGLFYGVFGVLKLAVYPDLFLLFGTISLLIRYLLVLRLPAL